MTTEQIIGFALALLAMGIALAGSIIPIIPGTSLIFLVALGHRLYFDMSGASTWVLVVMAGITLFSMVIDFFASVMGAKGMGASRRGMCGAVIGGVAGLFFSWPGLLLGPFIGAFLLELSGNRSSKEAAKAGVGAVLGLFLGALGKMMCCVLMIILFAASVIMNSIIISQ